MHFLSLSALLYAAFAFPASVAAIPSAASINIAAVAEPLPPNLSEAQFIWTKEGEPFPNAYPIHGPRGFRRTVVLKEYVDRGYIDITCDNFYTVYVNGFLVGSTTPVPPENGDAEEWLNPKRFKFALPHPAYELTIAVFGVQATDGLQAAVLLSSVFWSSPSGDPQGHKIVTDKEWKTLSMPPPTNFTHPKFEEKDWNPVYVEGSWGVWPYGAIVKPTSPVRGEPVPLRGIPGSEDAPNAEPVKYIA